MIRTFTLLDRSTGDRRSLLFDGFDDRRSDQVVYRADGRADTRIALSRALEELASWRELVDDSGQYSLEICTGEATRHPSDPCWTMPAPLD